MTGSGRYLRQKPKLLREFGKTVSRIRPLLVSRYGAENAESPSSSSPAPGSWRCTGCRKRRRPRARPCPAVSAWFLAMYRVPQGHGRSVEEAG